ncbi:MAG TPA: MaoC family dehydratase N-terminal domain-containing protein [Casimicrobiaceae bacterium]|nr:MaoC family dehydratase N-terminal domain-containing protein [Casimicrobiaceae bacterium]
MNDGPTEWSDWIGRSETGSDVLASSPYAALCATLDYDVDRPTPGTPLPPLWHWLYFLPLARRSQIGHDGHPRRGGFLPPIPLPRRMWAGSQLEFCSPLCIGDECTRTSTIHAIEQKHGRSGTLIFVKLRHEIRRNAETDAALIEFHDIVYREAPTASDRQAPPTAALAQTTWVHEWTADDVLLFRYSALTFNGHRIHYDRRYVTDVEGYPGLVVHGPLLATLMLELLRNKRPDANVHRYEFKAIRPVFDLHPFFVCGEPGADGKRVDLWVRDHEGSLAMRASATLR